MSSSKMGTSTEENTEDFSDTVSQASEFSNASSIAGPFVLTHAKTRELVTKKEESPQKAELSQGSDKDTKELGED